MKKDRGKWKAKVWPYMAANLIYTFSYGSICSCHVCTTCAVCLCELALYGHCAEIGLALYEPVTFALQRIQGTRFSERLWKRIHFKRIQFNCYKGNDVTYSATHVRILGYADDYMENKFLHFYQNYALYENEKYVPGRNGHLNALCQLLAGFTLIINQGYRSLEAHSSISEPKQHNASQRGPWINISAALQSDTALQAL